MRLLLSVLRVSVAASGDDLNPAVSPQCSVALPRSEAAAFVSPAETAMFVRLLESSQCRTIGNIEERKLKGAATIIAAAGVEFRTVIGKCKQVPLKNCIESGSGGSHLSVGVFALDGHDVGEPPVDFRIAARKRRHEHGLRIVRSAARQIDFRQMDARLRITW